MSKSVYQRIEPTDKNGILTEFLLCKIECSDTCIFTKNTSGKEKNHIQIKNTINMQNGTNIIDMLNYVDKSEGNDLGKEEFIDMLQFKKSRGTIKLNKYQISIKYRIDKEGYVYFETILDLKDYKYTGEEFESNLDYTNKEHCIEFYKAFSKAYPILPTNHMLQIDLSRIARYSTYLKIGDVAEILRWLTKAAWIIPLDSNINTKSTYYEQWIYITSYDVIPVVSMLGQSIDLCYRANRNLIERRIEPDCEYETPNWLFRVPETTDYIEVLSDGTAGYLCDGEFIGVRKKDNFENMYDIISIKNIRKYNRHKNYYKENKFFNPDFKCPNEDKIGSHNIVEKVCVSNFKPKSETELRLELRSHLNKHKIANVNGYIFDDYTDISREKIIDENTTWFDICTKKLFKNENEQQRNTRLSDIYNIENRLGRGFFINGLETTTQRMKDNASSTIFDIGHIRDINDKSLNIDLLNRLPAASVVSLDRMYSFNKSIQVDTNNLLGEENKTVKEEIYKFFTANGGKKINISDLKDIRTYINKEMNKLITPKITAVKKRIQFNIDVQIEEKLKENTELSVILSDLKEIKKLNIAEEKAERATDIFVKLTKLGLADKAIDFNEYLGILKEQYEYCKEVLENTINIIKNYSNFNTFSFKDKERVASIIEEYNRITGNVLQIQNFKMETIGLINNVVDDLDKFKDTELKKEAKKLSSNAKKLKRIIKKNLYKDTDYRDLVTSKKVIKLDNVCNDILKNINILIQSKITEYVDYDKSKLAKLQENVVGIKNKVYAIEYGDSYSKYYYALTNKAYNSIDESYKNMYC